MLGAILLSEQAHYAYVVEEALKPEDFYVRRHRPIYEAMLDAVSRAASRSTR